MPPTDDLIARWLAAGVLDESTAARIRAYEANRTPTAGFRWQVMLALAFGAILLLAGIALFVAAHWERIAPFWRFVLVLFVVGLVHAAAIWSRPRFGRLATALHAIGTGATGIAIFTVGQIFNLEEHWPAAILVWTLAAAAGWWLLNDQPQQTWTLLLLPAWAFCEWGDRTQDFAGTELMLIRAAFLLGVVFLLAPMRYPRLIVRNVLLGIGMVLTGTGVIALQAFDNLWNGWALRAAMPGFDAALGWVLIFAAPAFAVWWLRKQPLVLAVIALFLIMALALPHMSTTLRASFRRPTPLTLNYLAVAVLAAALAFLGTRERQPYLVNFGVIGFGLTVLWFYFSDIMDKLDRSFALIVLGLLFVAGGWALERLRRRMVHAIEEEPA